jgi:predicted dehydrogenase
MKGERIVIGQVGYGYWGPNLMRNYMECKSASVKYLCDKSTDQLAKAQLKYPSLSVTHHVSDLLNDPEVDAVIIATPISSHFKLAEAALLAGKHVFIEKPLAASSIEAEKLIKMAEERSLVLMVGHTFEYSSPVVKIKEIIDSGELGNIYYISSSRINLGLHQSDVSVIWDLAPHDFSMIFYWLGEEPIHIASHGRSCIQPGIHDVAFVNLAFASGVVAEVQLSWLAPVKLRRTLVVGDKKMLLYDDTESVEKIKLFDHGVTLVEPNSFGEYQLSYRTGDIISPHINIREPLFIEAEHFIECIQTGELPKTGGSNGLRVVKALEQAEMSLMMNTDIISKHSASNGDGDKRNGNGHKNKKVMKSPSGIKAKSLIYNGKPN